MKRIITSCVLASVMWSPALLAPSASHGASFRPGQLAVVSIIVRGMKEQPPNRAFRKAKIRDRLFSRYFLRTGRKQKARLQLADGTTLNINQRTDAILRDPHHLTVRSGEVDQIDARGSTHQISAATAVAAALGTNFDVKVTHGKVFITVVGGRVDVRNPGGRVRVRPNQQTGVIGRGGPSRPKHVNAQAITAWTRGLNAAGWVSITPPNQQSRSFSSISALAVGGHGRVFGATDLGIIEFTSNGKKVKTFGPRDLFGGLAVDRHHVLYVATPQGIAKY